MNIVYAKMVDAPGKYSEFENDSRFAVSFE
jgi:hypothetical protein